METKGLTCKIPLELHNQISEDIRAAETTISKFVEMVIREHYENKRGEKAMEKTRTLAFQVSEELFQKVKRYLNWYEVKYSRQLTQKSFVIELIEDAMAAVEDEMAAYEASTQAQTEAATPASGESEDAEDQEDREGDPEDDGYPADEDDEPENAESPTDGTEN